VNEYKPEVHLMAEELIYVDRYICYENVSLECEAEYKALTHWNRPYMNNAYTILRFTAGHWNALVEGSSYMLAPGEFCLLKRLEACLVTPLDYPCAMQRISYSPYYFRVIDQEMLLCKIFEERSFGIGNRVTATAYDESRLRAQLAGIAAETDIGARRLALVIVLAGLLLELYQNAPLPCTDTRPAEIRGMINYLNDHYADDIDLDKLTKRLYLSRSQLAKVVKSATGFTTWDYILHKRIHQAAQLLHSGIPSRDVARMVGFRDYSAFYKAFTKINISTPNIEQPSETSDPMLTQFYIQEDARKWMMEVFGRRDKSE
jgi:AraC-like DNA-binding protein